MIEADGTPQERRTDYTYDPRFHSKVATITEPSVWSGGNKVTTNTYDDFGNLTQTTITGYTPGGQPVTRTTGFQYTGPLNQLTQIDGPRTDLADITGFTYYPNDAAEGNNRARLQSVTSGGILLRNNIQYTATGKVSSETRPNGLTLSYTYYHGNDRLETFTETAGGVSKTTRWTYLATGEVQTITTAHGTPDATTLTFGYDDARRLTHITDGLGNYLQYTLDTEGNQTGENIYDATDALRKTLSRTFDVYNRMDITTQANETLNSDFAPDGTLDQQTDGRGTITDYNYDSLRRLISTTQDLGGTDTSTQNALTQYGYDVQDNLTSVTDPNNGTTTYLYDDLGNLTVQTSPDTGATTFTQDSAGNVTSQMDSKGQVFSYTYDALNRLTTLDAPGTADDIAYSYDICTNGTGRLCSITTATTSASYSYDGFGNVTQHQGIGYTYDNANRIETITYPSGNIVTYTYDAAGQVSSVELTEGATTTVLASAVSYAPFGPVDSLTFGNGQQLIQQLDNAYRLTSQTTDSTLAIDYTAYDANGNLLNRTIDSVAHSYQYDTLNRLDTATGTFGSRDYGYDQNGNRLTLNDGAATTNYSYTPNTNRLSQIGSDPVALDLNGNTYAQADWSYGYTTTNRLKQVLQANSLIAGYDHNGLGQRVAKTTHNEAITGNPNQTDYNATVQAILGNGSGTGYSDCNADQTINVQDLACLNNQIAANTQDTPTTTSFTYGLNGELLAESGATNKEYIYLNGTPLAVIDNTGIYYIHTDHLATPYKLTDSTGTVVWSAVYDPFGKATPNEDPDNNGTSLTFNLRFPGQYADAETGLHYNYFRTYDPATGRYITSDPIGLAGGLNSYIYVYNDPIGMIDPKGLMGLTLFLNELKRPEYRIAREDAIAITEFSHDALKFGVSGGAVVATGILGIEASGAVVVGVCRIAPKVKEPLKEACKTGFLAGSLFCGNVGIDKKIEFGPIRQAGKDRLILEELKKSSTLNRVQKIDAQR